MNSKKFKKISLSSANNHSTELEENSKANGIKMSHVQAVTVTEETSHSDDKNVSKNIKSIMSSKNNNIVKRTLYKDSNNNEQQITKESLNVTSDEPQEYSLLGLVTFKSPIKWVNSISIILIHLIAVYAFITYPLYGGIMSTLWGKL